MDKCPICDSTVIDYVGVDDGAGGHGDWMVDIWRCCDCGYRWDEPWIDPEDTQNVQLPLFPEDKKSWDNYS